VPNFEDRFFVLEILKYLGVHLDVPLEGLIEHRIESVKKHFCLRLGHFVAQFLVLVEHGEENNYVEALAEDLC